ncbi:MAG: hypothetical protein ACJA0S_000660 [Rickettsiales bacterium]|jgi:hypothetical protein
MKAIDAGVSPEVQKDYTIFKIFCFDVSGRIQPRRTMTGDILYIRIVEINFGRD